MLNNLLLSIWSYLYGSDKTDTQLEAEYAVMKNDIDAFKKLHTSGLDINTPIKGPFDGAYSNFLEMSIRYKAYDIMQYLVDQNVEINYALFGEHPPLHHAIWHEDNKLLDIFMSHKNLDVNKLETISDETVHPLSWAYFFQNFHAFSAIVDDERTDFSIKHGIENPSYPVMDLIEAEEEKSNKHLEPLNLADPRVIGREICLENIYEFSNPSPIQPSEYMLKLFSTPRAATIIDDVIINRLNDEIGRLSITYDTTYEQFQSFVKDHKQFSAPFIESYIEQCKAVLKARDKASLAEKNKEVISESIGSEDVTELVKPNATETEHSS